MAARLPASESQRITSRLEETERLSRRTVLDEDQQRERRPSDKFKFIETLKACSDSDLQKSVDLRLRFFGFRFVEDLQQPKATNGKR